MRESFYQQIEKMPIYAGYFHVILTNSIEKSQKILGKDLVEDDEYLYAHQFYFQHIGIKKDLSKGYAILLNFWNKNNPISYSTIAHECYHLAMTIAEVHGFRKIFDDHEPTAYLVGYFMNETLKFIEECGLKSKIQFAEHDDKRRTIKQANR